MFSSPHELLWKSDFFFFNFIKFLNTDTPKVNCQVLPSCFEMWLQYVPVYFLYTSQTELLGFCVIDYKYYFDLNLCYTGHILVLGKHGMIGQEDFIGLLLLRAAFLRLFVDNLIAQHLKGKMCPLFIWGFEAEMQWLAQEHEGEMSGRGWE